MKKLFTRFAALCCCAALLTLAACGPGDDNVTPTALTTAANERYSVGVEEFAVTKDLVDDAGEVVYKLNIVLPQLDDASFTQAQAINSVYLMRAQELQEFAENNVKNASSFLSQTEDAEPWVCSARYSVTYRDARYISILCEYSYGMGTASRSKRLVSDCFLLETGVQCELDSFLISGVPAERLYDMIADSALEKMVDSNGVSRLLPDIGRAELLEKFSPSDFYITQTGITFFYQLATIAPFAEGVLEFPCTAEELQDILTLPMSK